MNNKLKDNRNYQCPHCGAKYVIEASAKECEKDCKNMIEIYMHEYNVNFKEAKKYFLMELL